MKKNHNLIHEINYKEFYMPNESDSLELFSSRHIISDDAQGFRNKVMVQLTHSRVDPCFMTGKGCVYSDSITREIENRHNRNCCSGFLMTPFRNNLKVFIRNSLRPYFENHYAHPVADSSKSDASESCAHIGSHTMHIETAEEVRRPGVIICEGICKRLQQSDFVIADISLPNANVFYELGLSYGINHKIVLIYQEIRSVKNTKTEQFGEIIAAYLNAKAFAYPSLLSIKSKDFVVSNFVWQRNPTDTNGINRNKIVFYEQSEDETGFSESDGGDNDRHSLPDIDLEFSDHLKSNVNTAIGRIYDEITCDNISARKVIGEYFDIIKELHCPETIKASDNFSDILSKINSSYCLIVRTGKSCHPMSYFWLGYAHARGMNVIPITVQKNDDSIPKDLAFDIRAQRHMVFVRDQPERLERELTAGLRDMIYGDFPEWSRKQFWERMLGRPGVVSIFTAALHSENHDREMIGDWDLRAASELASFFNQHQIRATIETPIYQPEYSFEHTNSDKNNKALAKYIEQLQPLLQNKNCILIASPDVNPLTEFILGNIYNVKDGDLFSDYDVVNMQKQNAIVAVKEVSNSVRQAKKPRKRVFYRELQQPANCENFFNRGFQSKFFEDAPAIMAPFHSQSEPNAKTFDTYGHLVILPNPFSRSGHYIIVLNGISGPATFALTHVLTGNEESEFSAYKTQAFSPAEHCENILNKILLKIPMDEKFKAIQCIIKVSVGADPEQTFEKGALPYDWRRILSWSLYGEGENEKGLAPAIQMIPK